MKIVMFFASLLSLPICYLVAIIPTSLLMALWDANIPWLIWVFTAIIYLVGLQVLMSAADSYQHKRESTK
ncbi:MAG: hypothetical protein AB1523_00285 [Bacillota bacterium]